MFHAHAQKLMTDFRCKISLLLWALNLKDGTACSNESFRDGKATIYNFAVERLRENCHTRRSVYSSSPLCAMFRFPLLAHARTNHIYISDVCLYNRQKRAKARQQGGEAGLLTSNFCLREREKSSEYPGEGNSRIVFIIIWFKMKFNQTWNYVRYFNWIRSHDFWSIEISWMIQTDLIIIPLDFGLSNFNQSEII